MKLRTILDAPCPYSCVYCYKEGMFTQREDRFTSEDFRFVIQQAARAGFTQLKLTGGEPTNYEALLDLIKSGRDANYSDMRMTTIGLKLANLDFCESLRDAGLDGVTISVNSFNPETYRRMMNSQPGDFKNMCRGLENAVQVFGHSVTMNTVLNAWNLNELGDVIKYASERGLGVKILEMLDEEQIAPEGLYIPIVEFKKHFGLGEGRMINPTRELVRVGGARIYLVNSCCARQECETCRKGYQVVRVTPDGKLKTCISTEFEEASIIQEVKRRDESKLAERLREVTKKFRVIS